MTSQTDYYSSGWGGPRRAPHSGRIPQGSSPRHGGPRGPDGPAGSHHRSPTGLPQPSTELPEFAPTLVITDAMRSRIEPSMPTDPRSADSGGPTTAGTLRPSRGSTSTCPPRHDLPTEPKPSNRSARFPARTESGQTRIGGLRQPCAGCAARSAAGGALHRRRRGRKRFPSTHRSSSWWASPYTARTRTGWSASYSRPVMASAKAGWQSVSLARTAEIRGRLQVHVAAHTCPLTHIAVPP